MASTVTMLDQALVYLHHGWPIFPVCTPIPGKPGWCIQHGEHAERNKARVTWTLTHPNDPPRAELAKPGKHPLVPWAWLQKELPSEDTLISWWTKWPDANIGLATGALSGVIVLDSDSMDAFTSVLSNGGVEPTLQVITGRANGTHWYLRHPGFRVHNFASPDGHDGLDLRGDGGYAVLPPSLHEAGQRYRWLQAWGSIAPSSVPEWLSKLFDKRSDADAMSPPLDLSDFLTGINDGHRDDALWRLASKMRADDLPKPYAEFMIAQAAAMARPAFSASEAINKVHRAYEQFKPNPKLVRGGTVDVSTGVDDAPAVEERWAFEVLSAKAFLDLELPPLRWLVHGYIEDESLSILYGGTGTQKTAVSTNLALALATGGAWLDSFATEQTRTLVVQEDTPKPRYQQKYLGPAVEALGINRADLDDWLWIAASTGFQLDQSDRCAALEAWVQTYEPEFLILDAFYLLHHQNTNDETAIVPLLQWLRDIRNRYHLGILVIDHSRKPPGGKPEPDPVNGLYGGQAKGSVSDAMFELLRVNGEPSEAVLHVRKLRADLPPEPIRIRRELGRIWVVGKNNESLDGTARVVHDWLIRQGGTRTYKQISEGVNLSVKTVTLACRQLEKNGLAIRGKFGKEITHFAVDRPFSEEDADDGLPL